MGLISTIETRSGGVNDPNMWIGTLLESSNFATKSGVSITADTALNISTVYACVTILSQTLASLPMTINRRLSTGGNEIAYDHPLFPILHDNFNTEQTSYESREMGIGHLKLRGNWYNRLERNGAGEIVGIWPLNPQGMSVFRSGNDIWYQYTPSGDEPDKIKMKVYASKEIWHVKGFSKDGLIGLSTIQYARESMGLTQALQNYSAEFFGNRAVPGNIVRHPGPLKAPARANLKESLQEYATSKRHTTLILEEGMEWESVGLSNKDAQYLELSNAQVRDIARWFNVPLILLQEPDKVSTYASAEQFMLSYVIHSMSIPLVARVEPSANRALLTQAERKAGYYIKLNVNGLLRGDFKTRMEGYRISRDGGWKCVDEIRALEDEPPLPDGKGKIYLQPLNYVEAGTEAEPKLAPKEPDVEPEPDEEE